MKAPKSLDNLVVMGRIAAPYGIKGWVKILTFSESADTLADYPEWQIGRAGDWRTVRILNAHMHTNILIAELENITDRDAALALKGSEIAVPRETLPPAPENEYYWSDLIGLDVINTQGILFGKIKELLESGAHDVLVIDGERERLIPFVGQIVKKVDLTARTLEVDWEADY
ncbi:MAG: ribosome maturation factor RimM [Sulfuriferula sp.]